MKKRMIEQLNCRLSTINRLIASVDKSLSALPAGNLHIHQIRGNIYYYADYEGYAKNRKTPIYDKKLICSLAQRSYYLKILRAAEAEGKAIELFLKRYPERSFEDVYESLSEQRQSIITPVRLPDKAYIDKWLNTPYVHKPFGEGDPYYVTDRGERVRSKSEQLIANRLLAKGIPYKYECPINVGGKIFHPDFTILRISDRKEIYYEHLGKMGDEEYAHTTILRINKYVMNGIALGEKLFTTMESYTAPLDLRVLDQMIESSFR
ncbi:MAG: hypothetical protein ILA15_11220 [Clostridiales bacterium]|nr:hypothetical protein [Clostridiales bacterium]